MPYGTSFFPPSLFSSTDLHSGEGRGYVFLHSLDPRSHRARQPKDSHRREKYLIIRAIEAESLGFPSVHGAETCQILHSSSSWKWGAPKGTLNTTRVNRPKRHITVNPFYPGFGAATLVLGELCRNYWGTGAAWKVLGLLGEVCGSALHWGQATGK